MMLTPSSIQIAWLSLVKWPILRLDTAITKCLIKNIKINLTLVFQWTSENLCRFDKKIGLPLKMQIFTNHFVFRRQPSQLIFFSPKKCVKWKQVKITNMTLQKHQVLCRFAQNVLKNCKNYSVWRRGVVNLIWLSGRFLTTLTRGGR